MEDRYNFKPYDKVLVRDDDTSKWNGDFFLRYIEGVKYGYLCLTTGYVQCIPYEGNEHLLGTTDKPSEPKQLEPSQPESPQVENKKGGIKEDFEIVEEENKETNNIKITDLRIGDIVCNPRTQFPMRVVGIYEDGTVYLDFDGNEGDVFEENCKDLVFVEKEPKCETAKRTEPSQFK